MPAFSALCIVTLVVISASVLCQPVEDFNSPTNYENDHYTETEHSEGK